MSRVLAIILTSDFFLSAAPDQPDLAPGHLQNGPNTTSIGLISYRHQILQKPGGMLPHNKKIKTYQNLGRKGVVRPPRSGPPKRVYWVHKLHTPNLAKMLLNMPITHFWKNLPKFGPERGGQTNPKKVTPNRAFIGPISYIHQIWQKCC